MNAANSRLSFALLILSVVLLVGGGLVFAANPPGQRVASPSYSPPVGVSDGGFYFSCTLDCGFEVAVERVRNALAAEGLGILSEVDFTSILSSQGDNQALPYLVLGVYDPELVYHAHAAEEWIGVVTPSNVVVRQTGGGAVAVGVGSPAMLPSLTGNPELRGVSGQLTDKMLRVLAALQ